MREFVLFCFLTSIDLFSSADSNSGLLMEKWERLVALGLCVNHCYENIQQRKHEWLEQEKLPNFF